MIDLTDNYENYENYNYENGNTRKTLGIFFVDKNTFIFIYLLKGKTF